ncbi:MAG: hypothetical protein M3127_08685 [Actinomycetota bacterium]|nr:hypothetical protein [Actinomycetota bacterium]
MTDSAVTGEEYFDDAHQAGSGGDPGAGPDAGTGQGAQAGSGAESVEDIADEVRDDIRLGHVVDDDVSHVLEERLEGAGIDMRPEDVDELAEKIERDAST